VASTTITNLLSNGTLSVYGVTGSAAATASALNFNGGTLKANATNAGATFIPATGVNTVLFSGGGTINNSGGNITIAAPIVPASGSGVTTITVPAGSAGSGYAGAPYVAISGGTATGGNIATAVANMVPDSTGNGTFKIGSITITSPGNYSVAPTTVTVNGGTPATAATGITFNTGTNITTGGITFTGSGTTTLSGTSTYTGPTSISSGSILKLTGVLGNTAVTVNSGAFLTGSGTITGSVNVSSGGLIDFTKDGLTAATSLTVGGLSLGAASSPAGLSFNVFNTSSDSIKLGSGILNDIGGAVININGTLPTGTNTYTLMSFGSQTGLTTASGGGFTIGTRPAGVIGFALSDTATALTLTITNNGAPTPTTAYWTGKYDTVWSDYSTGGTTNFASTADGNTDALQLPGSVTDVVFTAAGNGSGTSLSGSAVNTTLGLNFSVNSLTVNSTAGSVAINGSNALTINAAASTGSLGYAAGTGIVIQSGAGPVTIGTLSLIAASSQSWANNGANPLTINSTVTGTATGTNITTLTFNGSGSGSTNVAGIIGNGTGGGSVALAISQTGTGPVILGGSNTYTGGTTLNSGILRLASAGALNLANPTALTINSGTLDLNSNSVSVSSLTGGTAPGTGGIITDSSTTAGTTVLTDKWAGAVQTYYGTIMDGPTRPLAFNASGSGTISLGGTNAYSGGTQQTAGTLEALTNSALGTGTVTMSAGAVALKIANGVTLSNKIVVNAAAPGSGNGALSTVTGTDTATFSGEIDYNATLSSGGSIVGPATGGLLSFTGPIIEPFNNSQPFIQLRAGYVQLADATGNSSYPELLVATPSASLGHNNGIATNAVLVMNAGIIDLNGYNQTVAGLGLFTGATAGTITDTNGSAPGGDLGPGNGPLNTSVLTVNTSAAAYPDTAPSVYAGVIANYVQLIKTGAGTLSLTGSANTYFGGTVINQGVLAVSNVDNGSVSSPNGLGESLTGPADLIFGSPGGTLRYTGVTGSTGRSFTINDGVTATMDVSSATASLTVTGSASVDGTESASPASFAKGPGAGTLILTGTYPYHGNTIVNGGVLQITGSAGTPGSGSIIIATGGTLGGTGTVSGSFNHTAGTIVGGVSATAPTTGSLTFTDPVTLNGGTDLNNINAALLTADGVNQQGYINAAGGLTFGSTPEVVSLQFTGMPATGTTYVYNLFTYTGTLGGTPNLAYSSNLGRATYRTDLTVAGEVNVDVTSTGAASLYWNSTASSVWDVTSPSNASSGTANWLNAATSAPDKFAQGDNVTFADSGTVVGSTTLGTPLQTAITINTTVSPGSVTVTSNTSNYTFSGTGSISGTGALTLSGSSTLTLATSNTYTGGTNINGGILNLASNGSIGTLGTISFGGGVLQYSANNTTDYSSRFSTASNQPIAIDTNGQSVTLASNLSSPGGSLTKLGAGTLTLAGTGNTYNGSTTITAGILSVSAQGNLGGNGPIVFNGGTLTSAGVTLTNAVVISPAGGTLTNTGNVFFTGTLTGSGTLTSTPYGFADVFAGSAFVAGNNSPSASFTGTIISENQVNLLDISASPYANYVAAFAGQNDFIIGNGTYVATGPVQLGSLSGIAGSAIRTTSGGSIGPVTLQIGNLGTNTTFAGSIYGFTNNPVSLTKVGTGNLTLSGSNTYTGATIVSAGALTLASGTAFPSGTSLNVASGALVTVANHSTNAIYAPQLSSLTNTGTIDLGNNDLVVHNGSSSAITAQVAAGFNGGLWNGTSATGVITSTVAAADSTHLTAVGVATGLTNVNFENETISIVPTDVIVKYTYYGDANLDGAVDGSDYTLIDAAFTADKTTPGSVTGWQNGDFNYDGKIDGSDYTLIDNAFNTQGATLGTNPAAIIAGSASKFAGGSSAVPEPATLGLFGIGAIGLMARRSRRRR
jgi:autotransporter-associated beta strand protein